LEEGHIRIVSPETIPEKIKYEISVASGEIEIVACAMEREGCVVLIDDSRVYRVMDRCGLKYISSANIIIDAYLTARIDKDKTYRLLEVLRMVLRDEVIDKAMEVLEDVGSKA
jgi:predicted nucleic acid-binding protein